MAAPHNRRLRLWRNLSGIFSAILHGFLLKSGRIPARNPHNLMKNLPHICTPMVMRCSLKIFLYIFYISIYSEIRRFSSSMDFAWI